MQKMGFVYILTNYRKSVLYVGVTSNLERRMYQHKYQPNSAFAKKYKVKYLVHYEVFGCPAEAILREKALKGKSRVKKEEIIRAHNPNWSDLSLTLFDWR